MTHKVSVFVMTYNNIDKIKDCLESVTWADEIVVMDSFSTDGTVEVCRQYTGTIVQEKFIGFGALRNKAVASCANDWILSIDSDERCTPELRDEVRALLVGDPACGAYHVPRKTYFLDTWVRHCGWYPDYRQPQFFNRNKMRYREQLVHEGYELDGRLGYLKGHAIQYPFLNLEQFLQKMDRYSSLRATEMFKDGKKFSVLNIIVNPLAMFFRMYVAKRGFLDGTVGLMLSLLYGYYYTMIKYVKLWEKYRRTAA